MDPTETLVVGTRGSQLARAQSQWVIDRLQAAHPGLSARMEIITTRGDRQQTKPLPEIGGKGLFTEELEQALRQGRIDLAVHSAKDLPTNLAEGLAILAVPVREDPRDAWVAADGTPFERLPAGSAVGTSSLRRQAQLLARRPDLTFVGLRGNVDTRIRKIHGGSCAGAVLAMAGLNRLDLARHVTHPLEVEVMLPAPGQGALVLEGRTNDVRLRGRLAAIHDEATTIAVETERAILRGLDAGCRAPVAVYAHVVDDRLQVQARVLSVDGRQTLRAAAGLPPTRWNECVAQILSDLRRQGAEQVVAACRERLRGQSP
ncbi:MAG TPA: hydroxymethylbilane synthase [Phycisphaerae bacterium]|nr:hydroxymethylbilane synthase [Phycisphaerae bacterium]HRY67056.1 hydroxymethylbilane synthase [Phycisphaerae bacterium]HSA27753.1 hydroxymethylbilane synthase [Phycisphaerae bacterium]